MVGEARVCVGCGRTAGDRLLCADCDARARSSYLHVSGDGTANYDSDLFSLLEKVEARSFWFRSRNRLILWALERYFPRLSSFLEVGCGTGFVLAAIHDALPHVRVMGSELYPEGLEIARRRLADVPLVRMDALDVRFARAFDAVGAFDVLEHIEDDETVLGELREAVAPGGGLLVTVPQHARLWSAADDFAGHVRRYARGELLTKARRAGWQPLRVTSFVSLALPLLAVSRVIGARSTKQYAFEREFRLPKPADRGLEAVMGLERALLTRGVSFRAGGSLLLVGRRVS